jgi:hypothetical protein
MGLPWQEEASCFAAWVHFGHCEGEACVYLFFMLPGSLWVQVRRGLR